jgi:hypothetical protein
MTLIVWLRQTKRSPIIGGDGSETVRLTLLK